MINDYLHTDMSETAKSYTANKRGYKKYLKEQFNYIYSEGEYCPFADYASFCNVERRDLFTMCDERLSLLNNYFIIADITDYEYPYRRLEAQLLVTGLDAIETPTDYLNAFKTLLVKANNNMLSSISTEVKAIILKLNIS